MHKADCVLPKAILFDLDDTLISYNAAADSAWKKVCDTFTKNVKVDFSAVVLLKSINKVSKWYWGDPERHRIGRMNLNKARRDIVRMALRNLHYMDKEKADELADNYGKLQEESICLFPDSISTLEQLKNIGIRMGLVTNGTSEKQRGKINRFCLSGYFEVCIVEGEVGYGKPDVRTFQTALEMLGLKPEDVWMVGDNLVWDIEAPQSLGIYSVWHDYKKLGLPAESAVKPDRIIHSIAELL